MKCSWGHVCPGSRNCASRLRSQGLKLAPHAPFGAPSVGTSLKPRGLRARNEKAKKPPGSERESGVTALNAVKWPESSGILGRNVEIN